MYGYTTIAVAVGILLDFIVGDPHKIPHPVCFIGKLITALEIRFRMLFPDTAKGKRLAGMVLWFIVIMVSGAVPAAVLYAAWRINPLLYCMTASAMCCQIMATKSLKDESMKVYQALAEQDIVKARYQVSMIVGRDTKQLDADGVARAAVETVAENTSDGSIAPMFYMMLGGAVLGFVYKAVNTMDSMLGYQNETYLDFGRTAAKMDDVWNFIPSRLAALFMP
ncbi:MAG: adenosylcobinamide-phosphate synthase CbiB, partial [Lachnospiraceae bacterium]|nr:adenosylcobinamide-phosphate synthase CbiB [Lachnospiraceae bacterium]